VGKVLQILQQGEETDFLPHFLVSQLQVVEVVVPNLQVQEQEILEGVEEGGVLTIILVRVREMGVVIQEIKPTQEVMDLEEVEVIN
jgi:hypothetical protein